MILYIFDHRLLKTSLRGQCWSTERCVGERFVASPITLEDLHLLFAYTRVFLLVALRGAHFWDLTRWKLGGAALREWSYWRYSSASLASIQFYSHPL